ncbi:hypothetical protein Sjap_000196 [Stephania japonica]|uniref:F-box associated domain-containing protein n=1 Tax=Stephania japonica TaxID=461633 RepID=A0AAP0KHJ5_9MAGN
MSECNKFISLPFEWNDIVDYNHIECPLELLNSPVKSLVSILGSCNGLVLMRIEERSVYPKQAFYYLWNPCTKDYIQLPKPPSFTSLNNCGLFLMYKAYGFGYDSTADDYKVIKINSHHKLNVKREVGEQCLVYFNIEDEEWVVMPIDLSLSHKGHVDIGMIFPTNVPDKSHEGRFIGDNVVLQQSSGTDDRLTLIHLHGGGGYTLEVDICYCRGHLKKQSLYIWNPCTKDYMKLPKPPYFTSFINRKLDDVQKIFGFGYDSTADAYKNKYNGGSMSKVHGFPTRMRDEYCVALLFISSYNILLRKSSCTDFDNLAAHHTLRGADSTPHSFVHEVLQGRQDDYMIRNTDDNCKMIHYKAYGFVTILPRRTTSGGVFAVGDGDVNWIGFNYDKVEERSLVYFNIESEEWGEMPIDPTLTDKDDYKVIMIRTGRDSITYSYTTEGYSQQAELLFEMEHCWYVPQEELSFTKTTRGLKLGRVHAYTLQWLSSLASRLASLTSAVI